MSTSSLRVNGTGGSGLVFDLLTLVIVRTGRVELPRPCGHQGLSLARLPIPPRALGDKYTMLVKLVVHTGFEPVASTLSEWRSNRAELMDHGRAGRI